MINKLYCSNQVIITGKITKQPALSHEVFGEEFYIFEIAVERLSNSVDLIQVMVSNRLLDMKGDYVGKEAEIKGQFRSYNQYIVNKRRLILTVFAREINLANYCKINNGTNIIPLDGYICKPPIYRITPMGREIADIIMAVNRPYGSDYIPCICWGRNAHYVQTLEVGSYIGISGRIQSREYVKKVSECEVENRIAYEISVINLQLIL